MHSELNMPVSVTNNCDTFNSPKLVPKGCKSNTSPNKCPTPPIQHQHGKNKHNSTILLQVHHGPSMLLPLVLTQLTCLIHF